MSALTPDYLTLLHSNLISSYLPHLPPLVPHKKSADDVQKKNLSRCFSAFTIRHLTDIGEVEAAQAVVDDFDDYGLDAIYYHAPAETVYLIQSKLKASQQFTQEEALAFCQGIRKLLKQDLDDFNAHVQARRLEITDALDNCSAIQLVVAHTGSGISKHAKDAVDELIADETHGEDRLKPTLIDFDAIKVVAGLQTSKAHRRVDARIAIQKCSLVAEPRTTYFGLVKLRDLVALHMKWDKALYDKNIRTFLGHHTEVNISIQKTLRENPEHFLFLNNGVTVLGERINPKGTKGTNKRIDVDGFSVINGAQTIASSAKFVADNPNASIESARVMITVIQADADGQFGKSVTRARNHQNPVLLANFVALEDEQERLRRDLAHLNIHYAYKAEASDGILSNTKIRADEATHALAMFHHDPRYTVWLKKEPATLLDTSSSRYKDLFTAELTAFQLANAVRFMRYVNARMEVESRGYGPEKLTYKHGVYAFAWVLAKRVMKERNGCKLFEPAQLETQLSTAFDELRQVLWDTTETALGSKAPLAVYKSQTHAIPVMADVMVKHYGLSSDPVVALKQGQQKYGQAYPEELFGYLTDKAPQIGSLT